MNVDCIDRKDRSLDFRQKKDLVVKRFLNSKHIDEGD